MKIKFVLTIMIITALMTVVPGKSCLALQPEITREYIARKIDGERSNEEKVKVRFPEVKVMEELNLRVSFIDDNGSVLSQYDISLNQTLSEEDGFRLSSEHLKGTAYMEIEICGRDKVYNGVKLPFKI